MADKFRSATASTSDSLKIGLVPQFQCDGDREYFFFGNGLCIIRLIDKKADLIITTSSDDDRTGDLIR